MEVTVQVLGGRYELVEPLGNGGMAVVWRARDAVLGRHVAVKLLAGRHAGSPDARRRIRDEARAAAILSHPNIAQVYDYGEWDDAGSQVPYVVMELVRGVTLQQRQDAGPLSARFAMRVSAEVAAALAAAHAEGLVHRDIKPANVMVTPDGAKVVDFGIAAAISPSGAGDADGEILGTPAYLAPERLIDDAVEPASDVYALGVLLYRLLSGESPWSADTTTQMLTAHIYIEPAPLAPRPGVPEYVIDLCNRCLSKDPTLRPSAREVAALLARGAGLRVVEDDGASAAARTAVWAIDREPSVLIRAARGQGSGPREAAVGADVFGGITGTGATGPAAGAVATGGPAAAGAPDTAPASGAGAWTGWGLEADGSGSAGQVGAGTGVGWGVGEGTAADAATGGAAGAGTSTGATSAAGAPAAAGAAGSTGAHAARGETTDAGTAAAHAARGETTDAGTAAAHAAHRETTDAGAAGTTGAAVGGGGRAGAGPAAEQPPAAGAPREPAARATGPAARQPVATTSRSGRRAAKPSGRHRGPLWTVTGALVVLALAALLWVLLPLGGDGREPAAAQPGTDRPATVAPSTGATGSAPAPGATTAPRPADPPAPGGVPGADGGPGADAGNPTGGVVIDGGGPVVTPEQTGPGGGDGGEPTTTPPQTQPTTQAPEPQERTFSSNGGTVRATCPSPGTAQLLSWTATKPYKVNDVEQGPAAEARVVYKHGNRIVEMTITCSGGVPSQS